MYPGSDRGHHLLPAAGLVPAEGCSWMAIDESSRGEVTLARSPVPTVVVQQQQAREHAVEEDEAAPGDDDDDGSDSSSDYLSFAESDEEEKYPEAKAEREARARERQLVLEAAGLILTQNEKPPPGIVRNRSTKRRPPPAAPSPSSWNSKALPPVPLPLPVVVDAEPTHARRLDDAFDRYEEFKNKAANSNANSNRLSIASTVSADTLSVPSPTISSFPGENGSGSPSVGGGGKSYSHYLMHLLGRSRTPEGEVGLRKGLSVANISAPMMMSPSLSGGGGAMGGSQGGGEAPPRGMSPGFGTVCVVGFWIGPRTDLEICLL